jgi:hypothetical protein
VAIKNSVRFRSPRRPPGDRHPGGRGDRCRARCNYRVKKVRNLFIKKATWRARQRQRFPYVQTDRCRPRALPAVKQAGSDLKAEGACMALPSSLPPTVVKRKTRMQECSTNTTYHTSGQQPFYLTKRRQRMYLVSFRSPLIDLSKT